MSFVRSRPNLRQIALNFFKLTAKRPPLKLLLGTSTTVMLGFDTKAIIDSQKKSLHYACLLNVNAASALLTTSLFALEKVSDKYKAALNDLVVLLDECLMINDLNTEVWDSVIALRSEVTVLKDEFNNLSSNMETVNKVVSSVIEASFIFNASSLCTTLCEHSTAATEKIQKLEEEVQKLEQEYLLAMVNVTKIKKPKEDGT